MLAENIAVQSSELGSLDDELVNYAKQLRFGDVHLKIDLATGLVAIIAIHSTKLGPALGGCRLREYPTIKEAFRDAIRLAQGMSYKAAITGLPLGGGKSVLLKPAHIANREKYFEAFGCFIDELGGRYITAVDSGTSPSDMDAIAKMTKYVTSTSTHNGDPSPFTATGVKNAICAAVKFKYNKDRLDNFHIAIQGIGHVGYPLAHELHNLGARLTVADVNPELVQRCVDEFGATIVSSDHIHEVACDIFSPCAMGAILNDITIPQIKAPIIVGAANNQLAEPKHGKILHDRGLLYGPDFVVNAGGLIHASAEYFKTPLSIVNQHVANIYTTTMAIFERSAKENRPTSDIANTIAEEKLYAGE